MQPLQTDHRDGPYSDMQEAEKFIAKQMGIEVLAFKFKETEMTGALKFKKIKRDETAFKQRLEPFPFN